jgi:hypothetical protein
MKNNQYGQSTIEFIFTFAFGVSIILLVFNSAMTYTTGYLVHYATFMASRVYLTQESFSESFGGTTVSLSIAKDMATKEFQKYRLDIFGIQTTNFIINPPGDPANYVLVGAYTQFIKSIDAIGKVAGQTKLNLTSESFLGKEPTLAVCASRVCMAITGTPTCSQSLDITLFDDGC